ncbi:MAG: DUF4013 domain-containing protein [Candidatus Bathyarchaeia archaeon]
MLTTEFKNAFEYTKKLLNKESLFLFIACLIPFVNLVVLVRYVYKIVNEPSNTIKPPNLVKPDLTELIMSLIKIIAVAAVWLVIALALIVPVSLIFDAGTLGGIFGLMTLVENFHAKSMAAAIGAAVILLVISVFAVISEVNMIKRKKLMDAFAVKDLLGKISKIGWHRYLLFVFAVLVTWAIILFITSQVGNLVEIGVFTVSVAGILALLPVAFFARTISVLYDKNSLQAQ